jgi:hypothetical protein
MSAPKNAPKGSHDQLSRFIDTASALGCDDDKEKFEAALGKIAAHKPSKGETKKRSPKNRAVR